MNTYTSKHTSRGSAHIILMGFVLILAVVGFAAWRILAKNDEIAKNSSATQQSNTTPAKTTDAATKQAEQPKAKDPDSASTMDAPVKIATKDGKQHFYYGAPAGQNNASPKKIIITLHGTDGSAERDYEVWKPFVKDTSFALATLNWWDGSGGETSDYTTPDVVVNQIHDFLADQGYAQSDLIVYEGFSRGSANTYPVMAFDRTSSQPMIDVAVSSSGGFQGNYYDLTTKTIPTQKQNGIYKGVGWILACGGKDENPSRDGCTAMEQSKTFVAGKGAKVLGVLSDPNAGHGALTTSSLNLAKQMFELIEAAY